MKDVGLTFYENMPLLTPSDVVTCKNWYDSLCDAYGFVRSEKIGFDYKRWFPYLIDLLENTYVFETADGKHWYVSNPRMSEYKIQELIAKYDLADSRTVLITDGFYSVRTKAVLWHSFILDNLRRLGATVRLL